MAPSGSNNRSSVTDSKLPGKVNRLARSRAAWGIECIFPSSAGKAASKTNLDRRAAASPVTSNANHQSPLGPSPTASSSVGPSGATTDVAEQLKAMTERLQSIEATLARAQVMFTANAGHTSMPQLQQASGSRSHSGQTNSGHSPSMNSSQHELHQHKPSKHNPVEAAGEAMAIEGLVDLAAPRDVWDSLRPDVLGRLLMTPQECEAEFDIYFKHLQPWTMMLSSSLDREASQVRERSPLLFHVILLLSVYYRPRTPENVNLYRVISSIVDAILAPQILCPQPDSLSPDFVRAIHLLLLYKPVQMTMFNARGITDISTIEHLSKMNVRASWILRLLTSRVSAFIGLPSAVTAFARAFANQHLAPIPDQIVAEQRLYFACIFHESHGALQSGKPSNFVPHEALKTTRLFAKLKRQPDDVRLAASVELAAVAASVLARKQDNDLIDKEDLQKFDQEMHEWSHFWLPVLAAERDTDPLAWTTTHPYAAFIRVVINGFAFTRWKTQKKDMLAQGLAPLALSDDETQSIATAVRAAESILLAISLEGKVFDRERGIVTSWDHVGPTLTIDASRVERWRWATDSISCVVLSYPLIFLAKIANEGLLSADSELLPLHRAQATLSPMSPSDKLCRLLQLGADFLDAIAPNAFHPAVKQAAFLRRIRDAGISGRRSVISAPGSPRAGAASVAPRALSVVPDISQGRNGHVLDGDVMTTGANGSSSAQQNLRGPTGSQAMMTAPLSDFSLASSFQASPEHSPRQQSQQPGGGTGVGGVHQDDPFSALLSGVSPSFFDAAGGAEGLFGLPGYDGSAGGFGPSNFDDFGLGQGF
ncbi:hypothetical protein OIO90_005763 [Microbotryomycetes sp. JL221]|nr:hypothetical protein OIO90_005763 [Microbotryomycetes sp. JL221]